MVAEEKRPSETLLTKWKIKEREGKRNESCTSDVGWPEVVVREVKSEECCPPDNKDAATIG